MPAESVACLLLGAANHRREAAESIPEAALAEIGSARWEPQEFRSLAFNVHTSSIGGSGKIFNGLAKNIQVFLTRIL
jgi:hypothetical protein